MTLFSNCLLKFSCYGSITIFLSRLTFIVLITKVSQDRTSIRRMSRAMNETGFRFALCSIYIPFYALVSALYHLGVSFRKVRFSSLITDVTSTVAICLGRFLREGFNTPLHIYSAISICSNMLKYFLNEINLQPKP